MLTAAVGLAGSWGCSSRNAMGRRQVSLMPDALLNSQASTAFASEKQNKPVSTDARYTAILDRVGKRLIAQAEAHYGTYTKGFQWETVLFDAPDTINAYCMPGGKIGFYTGIFPVCKTEAGIAAVMGHEIAHALLKHGNERVTKQLGLQAVTALASERVAKKKGLDAQTRGAIMAAVGLGVNVGLVLPHSRVNENEADHMGILLMAHAGYDPTEAAEVWRRMKALGGKKQPEMLSTHPSHDRRIRRLTEFEARANPLYAAAAEKFGKGETL